MNEFAMWIGYAVMSMAGICFVAALLGLTAYCGNWAQHRFVDMCGGWRVFLEYRDWLKQERKKVRHDHP